MYYIYKYIMYNKGVVVIVRPPSPYCALLMHTKGWGGYPPLCISNKGRYVNYTVIAWSSPGQN